MFSHNVFNKTWGNNKFMTKIFLKILHLYNTFTKQCIYFSTDAKEKILFRKNFRFHHGILNNKYNNKKRWKGFPGLGDDKKLRRKRYATSCEKITKHILFTENNFITFFSHLIKYLCIWKILLAFIRRNNVPTHFT